MQKILYGLILATATTLAPMLAHAQVSISVNIAPPPLPVYVQPPIPDDGYMWTPGYWGWSPAVGDYYWVPGTWVSAPYVGALWTPGYWGWANGGYGWHIGYWGTQVGYYGGINYGFGYTGSGYFGGRWDHGGFNYNRTVNNINNVHITRVYNQTVINNNPARVSFNGGNGGIQRQPTREEARIASMQHGGPTQQQVQNEQAARAEPVMRASVNHGAPTVAATSVPGRFNTPNAGTGRPVAPAQTMQRSQEGSQRQPAMEQNAPRPAQPVQPNQAMQRAQQAPRPVEQQAAPRPQPMERAMPRPQPEERPMPQEQHAAPHQNAPHEEHEQGRGER